MRPWHPLAVQRAGIVFRLFLCSFRQICTVHIQPHTLIGHCNLRV